MFQRHIINHSKVYLPLVVLLIVLIKWIAAEKEVILDHLF